MEILKGKKYLCLESLEQNDEVLFEKDKVYKSESFNCLTTKDGKQFCGFNSDIAAKHFMGSK